MKKKKIIIIFAIILIGIFVGIFSYFYINNKNHIELNNYEASKTSTDSKSEEDNTNEINNPESLQNDNLKNQNLDNSQPPTPVENSISSFSTKIYTKDSARQNNINITCNSLNNTIVKNGGTFSFCSTVGQATSSKGYKKADIFDKNGNKKKGLRWR